MNAIDHYGHNPDQCKTCVYQDNVLFLIESILSRNLTDANKMKLIYQAVAKTGK